MALVIHPTKIVHPCACFLLICRSAHWLHTGDIPLSLTAIVPHASIFLRTTVLSLASAFALVECTGPDMSAGRPRWLVVMTHRRRLFGLCGRT
jgi:hypothetical protein